METFETRAFGSRVTRNRSARSARTEGVAEPGECQVVPGRVGHRDDRASSVQGDTHDKSLGNTAELSLRAFRRTRTSRQSKRRVSTEMATCWS